MRGGPMADDPSTVHGGVGTRAPYEQTATRTAGGRQVRSLTRVIMSRLGNSSDWIFSINTPA
jgi:hypothetical protein